MFNLKTDLFHIDGFNIKKLPFELEKVGDLLYFEGPLMSVYRDYEDAPYIFDWVDSDDTFNRWLVYRIDNELLSDYVYGKATHFQLINNSFNNVIFVVDKNTNGIISDCTVCTVNVLPYDYLPQSDLKFESEDSLKLDKIISTFNLVGGEFIKEHKTFKILEEAKKSNNELINLHINSTNSKVGYGKISSSILGQVLSSYSNLCTATAINIFDTKGKDSGEKKARRKKGELKQINQLGEFEFIYAKASSFSVFLRPIFKTIDLFNNETSSERITKSVFELFTASNDITKLRELKSSLNENMLSAYNSFLKDIKTQDISIVVKYANPKNDVVLEDVFTSKKAFHILQNLDVLEFSEVRPIKTNGHFRALDSINSTFKFESDDDDIYFGKFSEQLKSGIFLFNLHDYYSVTIEISDTKKSGKKNILSKETLVSCVEIKE